MADLHEKPPCKQELTDLFMECQAGNRSCRNTADRVLERFQPFLREWVNVEEGLPERQVRLLVIGPSGMVWEVAFDTSLQWFVQNISGWGGGHSPVPKEAISHWMYMPLTPK